MISNTDSAKGQLLRADHLFHVTLKYTRTVDVIRNTIKRLISALDFAIEDCLENNNITNAPKGWKGKIASLKKLFPRKKEIKEFLEFYLLLRGLDRAEYNVKEEYRKHVAMITEKMEIDVEKLKEFFDQTKEYVDFLQEVKK